MCLSLASECQTTPTLRVKDAVDETFDVGWMRVGGHFDGRGLRWIFERNPVSSATAGPGPGASPRGRFERSACGGPRWRLTETGHDSSAYFDRAGNDRFGNAEFCYRDYRVRGGRAP